jgi:hypothetical protein
MRKTKRLLDEYRFPGFRPIAKIKGKFGDSKALIIPLKRRQKKQHVVVAEQFIKAIMIAKHDLFVIYHVVASGFIWRWTYAELSVINVVK